MGEGFVRGVHGGVPQGLLQECGGLGVGDGAGEGAFAQGHRLEGGGGVAAV